MTAEELFKTVFSKAKEFGLIEKKRRSQYYGP